MLKDFRKFILRGNVVDLAVAVVIGAAFGAIVTSLVKDLVTPLIGALTGNSDGKAADFSSHFFTINGSKFLYGDFINAVISFIVIAAVIFFLVVQPLNKLMARISPKEEVDTPAERECPECLSAIPAAAKRCRYCTATLKPVKK
jgi:large conductance mechanosensitive channel